MNMRLRAYVVAVALVALAIAAALYLSDPSVPHGDLRAVLLLCAMGLVAETLTVVMPNTVVGSVAFIPYLAAALVAPNWLALAGVVVVRILVEMMSKRAFLVAFFNISQHTITFSSAVLVFSAMGGVSLPSLTGSSLAQATLRDGLPALAAFLLSFAVNSTLNAGYVAAKSRRDLFEVWRSTYLSTIGVDLLASPIVFLFAWMYAEWHAFAAAALWVPIIGLRQLQKTNLDLERSNSELLELMVKSMEARDTYTSGHSRRVQQFSVAIARAIGISPAEVDQVSQAALLHDVGKIYEKYAPILRKPGKLSAEEWQIMQQHPGDGAELVSTMSYLRAIVPCIRHHHERWDGTGYPDGLAGETIPRISRIIAFADTIDAMTSERPYRGTLTETDVRAEIVKCRGAQFDPEMTDRVLSASVWRHLFTQPAVDGRASSLKLVHPSKTEASRVG